MQRKLPYPNTLCKLFWIVWSEREIAAGNVVGSNLFNLPVLVALGATVFYTFYARQQKGTVPDGDT